MENQILVCPALYKDGTVLLLSPSIGRLHLLISENSNVTGDQRIGYLYRLDKKFVLKTPKDCTGKISYIKSDSASLKLGFREHFLSITRSSIETSEQKLSLKAAKIPPAENYITASMDGMFYLSSSPQDPPFVKIGDTVVPGQTIGLIEVMKSFYPVQFNGSQSAIITDIAITNASAVTSGTKLFIIKV